MVSVPPRIGVIVVHGVADQAPGDTAASFVRMMVATKLPGVRYEADGGNSYTIEVKPLAAKWRDDNAGRADVGQHTFHKAFRQSLHSDFRSDPDPGGKDQAGVDAGLDYTDYLLHKARRNRMPAESYTSQTTRLKRRVDGDPGAATTVDVHEMYWADQSRLSGALPRIVTELFTLFFRLSRLGRDTVEIAGRQTGRDPMWRALSALQKTIDWLFTHVLAQLTALLLVFGLFVAGIGLFAARPAPPADAPSSRDVQACADVERRDAVCQRDALHVPASPPPGAAAASSTASSASGDVARPDGGGDPVARTTHGGAPLQLNEWVAAGIGAVLVLLVWLAHRYQRAVADASTSRATWLAMGLCISVGLLLLAAGPRLIDPLWGVGLALALVLGIAYAAMLQVAEERFPFVAWSGALLGIGLLAFALASVVFPTDTGALERLQRGGVLAIETTLRGVLLWWVVMALLFPLWGLVSIAVGLLAYRSGDVMRRCSASTGRLGALLSLLCFATITMAVWAGLNDAVKSGLTKHRYAPMFWTTETVPAGRDKPAEWLCDGPSQTKNEQRSWRDHWRAVDDGRNTAQFLDCRFHGYSASFAAAVVMLVGVATYLVAALLPSVLAELGRARSSAAEAHRLGLWLTRRYRQLDRWILGFTVLAILIVACVGFEHVRNLNVAANSKSDGLLQWVVSHSNTLLRWFVLPGAGALAILTAFGGVLSRLLPGLRAPLDVALDVDNYLREFPRDAIPRARIYARYAALLQHVARRRYDRVVVVAHSQGAVISAELLRYLSSRSPAPHEPRRRRRVQALLRSRSVRMLTLGCPLRQLYAARFPVLYRWVMQNHAGQVGPLADDVGIERWFNAYGSGDYVGRWLWNNGAAPCSGMHPADDAIACADGHAPASMYDIAPPPPRGQREFQTCIGWAAHTHYFDLPGDADTQPIVALLADTLIAEPIHP